MLLFVIVDAEGDKFAAIVVGVVVAVAIVKVAVFAATDNVIILNDFCC